MLTDDDHREIERANATRRRAVVFLHGLWLPPSSWDRWSERFAHSGYATLTPGWPEENHDHETPAADREAIAGTTIEAVAQHYTQIITELNRKPAVVGHSFGGLVAQMLAGRGLAKVTVAIEPAPFRGMLPLPAATLRPLLTHPRNRNRAVPLGYEQFAQAFANALDAEETQALYDQFVVPAPGRPLFQAAGANLNPFTEAKVDTAKATRGPLLIISGEKDQMFSPDVAEACYQRQRRNHQVTEIVQIAERGHSITIDHGWYEVAEIAYAFIERFTSPF